jgi:hypothetical protein
MNGKEKPNRGAGGRFLGGRRVNVEGIPRLPTFPVAWTLADPRGRPYFVFWTGLDGALSHVLRLERAENGGAVRLRTPGGESFRVRIIRRPMPRRGGIGILFRCPNCDRAKRFLYLLSVVDRSLVAYQGPRCQACAGLRWSSQGRYQGFVERGFRAVMSGGQAMRLPYPRDPWDPRAVSDPRMVMAEFPDQLLESQPGQAPLGAARRNRSPVN